MGRQEAEPGTSPSLHDILRVEDGGLGFSRQGERKRSPADEGSPPYCAESRGYPVMVTLIS